MGDVLASEAAVISGPEVGTQDAEPGEALDLLLILRPVSDAAGRCVDAVIEFANAPWRALFSPSGDPAGRRLVETLPGFADRLPYIARTLETGTTSRLFFAMPGDPTRRSAVQFTPFRETVIVAIHEVTGEDAQLAAAREAEARYRSMADSLPDEVFAIDREMRYTFWNAECERRAGIAAGDALGRTMCDVFPSLADTELERATLDVLADGEPRSFIREVPLAGETRSFGVRIARTAEGAAFVSQDITDLVRSAEALRASEDRYRSLFDNLNAGLIRCRMEWTDGKPVDWTYLAVNRAHETLTGRRDVVGRRASEVLPGVIEANPELVETLGRVASGGSPAHVETFLPRVGEWIEVHAFSPAPSEFIAVFDEITERKRAQAELAEAQRIAHVGSWAWAAAFDTVTWSDELFRIFGLAPSATARSFAEHQMVYTEESRARLVADVSRAMETGEGFETEVEIVRADGRRRSGISRGEAVRDAAGAIVGLRGTVADLTELREAQARADRAQRAEMVGRLAGGVAHDFNNLLMTINGSAEFLAMSIPADDPRRVDIDAIREAGGRAATLTHQLLSFGRRQALRPVVLDVNEVVGGIVPMLRSLVGDDVELVVRRSGPVGDVRVDRAELKQAITSLVLNAGDAMSGGGRVTIETADVTIAAGDPGLPPLAAPGDYVRLTVTDTGTGIGAETLGHLFEPFFTTKAVGHGSGLGLPSVEGAVVQSGGFVTVESAVGTGSVFAILLPRVVREAAASAPSGPRPVAGGGSETILLVEDEPGVLTVTARILRDLGYAVVEADGPAHALEIAEAGTAQVDLLLTDVMMPGMNGRQLADRLTALRPGLPVLFMSGYSFETVFGGGLLERGAPLLVKPFTRDELADRVGSLVDPRRRGPAVRPSPARP